MFNRARLPNEINWGLVSYISLVVFLLLLGISHMLITFTFDEHATRIMPQLVLAVIIVATSLELVRIYLRGLDTSEFSADVTSIPKYIVQLLWLLGFILSMYYIGFFTATAAFSFVYILTNFEGSVKQKVIAASLTPVLAVGFLYILFIVVLKNIIIFRFGFLP